MMDVIKRLMSVNRKWCCTFFILSLVWGCTDTNDADLQQGEEAVVTFCPRLDNGLDTRAIADASHINQLKVMVFEAGKRVLAETYSLNELPSLRLIKGREYQILFWAQCIENKAYTLCDDGRVLIDYGEYLNGGFNRMEELDAFCLVDKIIVTEETSSRTVELSRPLAQLNFADDTDNELLDMHKAEIRLKNIVTSFNLLTGEIEEIEEKTFVFTDFPKEPLVSNEEKYNYVASVYLFPNGKEMSATYKLYSGNNEIQSYEFENLALEGNKRTNVLGSIVQTSESIWDGTLTVLEPNADNHYIIDEASKLAWLQENGFTLPAGTFKITKHLNMADRPMKPLQIPNGSIIEGGGKTIKNLQLDGALFGDVANIAIKDLVVDFVKMEGVTTHVGVLVNTLKSGGIFTNVTVSNSSVTTDDGAAGGMVGYLEDGATFTDCRVISTTISGSDAEGHFVGLMRGYDKTEILAFNSSCSVNGNTLQDYESLYSEGKEATWLAATDYTKYNGWLGREEFYRGIVNYGGDRFIPKWDGKTTVEPLEENNALSIYSAFDLAYLQRQSPAHVRFKVDVDLGGNRIGEINPFTPISSIKHLDGESHTLYNLYIEVDDMGGFISQAIGESTHENLTFENSSVVVHFVTLGDQDRGYAGTLTPAVWSGTDYTVSNMKVNNGYVFGLGKIGGLIGFIDSGTTKSTIKDCTVTGTTVKNERGKTQERFYKKAFIVEVDAKFYAQGEAGGLIGMIMGNSNISNCHVFSSTMDCYGEQNQKFYKIITIQGRHVNNFIGDIRTPGGQNITIDKCSATNNTYVTTDGQRQDDPFKHGSNSTNLVGEAYYLNAAKYFSIDTKGSVKIDGVDFL